MFGIALAEEPLPALPYLNMLNNLMFDPNSHWSAGIPPIARVPDNLAPHEYKAQYPGITDAQIKQMIAVKAPSGGIGPPLSKSTRPSPPENHAAQTSSIR